MAGYERQATDESLVASDANEGHTEAKPGHKAKDAASEIHRHDGEAGRCGHERQLPGWTCPELECGHDQPARADDHADDVRQPELTVRSSRVLPESAHVRTSVPPRWPLRAR